MFAVEKAFSHTAVFLFVKVSHLAQNVECWETLVMKFALSLHKEILRAIIMLTDFYVLGSTEYSSYYLGLPLSV